MINKENSVVNKYKGYKMFFSVIDERICTASHDLRTKLVITTEEFRKH